MKKILLFLLPIFILMIGSRALAAPSAADLKSFYDQNYQSLTGVSISQDYWNYFVNNASAYGNYQKVYMGVSYSSSYSQIYIFGGSNFTASADSFGFTINGTADAYYWNIANQPYTGIRNTLTNQTLSGGLNSTNVVNEVIVLDFSNPYYDPLLPVPEVEIRYDTEDYSSGNVPVLPISIALTNADAGYYVEVVQVNYMPSTVAVKYQDYTAVMSHKFEQRNLLPAQMLKISSTLSYDDLGDLAENAWSMDVVSYPVSNVVFTNQIGQDQGGVSAFNNMVDLYTNARRLGLFYGNNTELYFRYFIIDSDNRFVVSAWRTWSSSYSNSFGLALPSYYQTYSSASGYENTDNNTSIVISPTSQPNVVNPTNNFGYKTGNPININIGSNVPNYPDYPTIATYNTDNLLVNAIDTARQLPDFFQNVTAVFGGIFDGLLPPEFWQVVMMGFLFSIVIMIIKVL